ncbi:MAG: hypothetical protein GEU83_12020 [Pseudonocardiaceae bacterium]|nr:hypothetical protein [Pseudonocardiaceae bacterium]
MADVRRMLSSEEREEYDELFYYGTHYRDGKRRKPAEIGPKLLDLLRDAEQARKPWASWTLEDALTDGLRAKGNQWCNTKEIVLAHLGGKIVRKAAAYGTRARNPKSGKSEWQRPLWEHMSRDDLIQVIEASTVRSAAEDELRAVARRLLALVDETGSGTVPEALEAKGVTLAEFLALDGGAA